MRKFDRAMRGGLCYVRQEPRRHIAGEGQKQAMSRVAIIENGYVFPAGSDGGRPFTLCDANGAPVPEAQTTIKHSVVLPRYLPEAARAQAEPWPGTYLFGGYYLPHFGHFVLESLSRLWALEAIEEPLDGIVFLHLGRNSPDPAAYAEIFEGLGVTCPIHILDGPIRAGRLYVPQQGLGMGPNAAGLPEQREFLRRRFAGLAVPVEGHDKVYISRSGYGLKRGGMLGEGYLERTMERAGYHVFHPQREPLGVQVGTYLAASRIVSPDNSALHVAAFVAEPEQDVAIVLRRRHGAADLFPQLSVAMGHEPLVIDAIKQVIVHEGRRPANWGHYAELDFGQVYEALIAGGFLPPDCAPEVPRWRDLRREIDRMVNRFGGTVAQGALSDGAPELVASYF